MRIMNKNFRKITLEKIAANAGLLTTLVQKSLEHGSQQPSKINVPQPSQNSSGNFKDQFLKTPEGPAREALIYNAVVAKGPPKQLVPVTVDGPNGIKITYNVMPDYVMIDGVRVTMSPSTAQKVADKFNMKLPTDKMSTQIYNAADTKVRAIPLSGRGYVGTDGKNYTGQDVASTRIGKSDAALTYNNLTDEEIKKKELKTGKPSNLIAGHGKDILQPTGNPNDVRIGGWHGENGKALQPYSDTHKGEAANHTEYALYTRLIGNQVTITTPDGKTEQTTMDNILNNPNLSKIVSTVPGKKYI